MATEKEERARRIANLRAFYEAHVTAGLKNPRVWAKASGVSYNALNEPISGAKVPNISIRTLERAADGATKLLNRLVTIDELIGRAAPVPEIDKKMDRLKSIMTPDQKQKAVDHLESLLQPRD